MSLSHETTALGWASPALVFLGLCIAVYVTFSDRDSPIARAYFVYAHGIDVELRGLFIQNTTGQIIANWQLGLILGGVFAEFVLSQFGLDYSLALVLVPVVVIAPKLWLIRAKADRQTRIEAQMDTFLLALANALKASPSLGDALGACTLLLRSPIREELELTMKENQLGVPLDQALLNMATRVGSQAFSGSLTTVLIGRQTGGDLPKILETSAGTLREMARLEGVVRSKTAEGKAQAWVLGAVPPILVGLLNWIDPEWLRPLSTSFIGYIIVTVAILFWVAAVFAARKILAVDI